MADLVVVGSLNMDLVVRCTRIPMPGETVLGSSFQSLPGGKGANQAYAAAKLSRGKVAMIGRVGCDAFGEELKLNLERAGVDVGQVIAVEGVATGIATITVDATGQNSIVVTSGANFCWDMDRLEGLRETFRGAKFALFQLETPLDVVMHLMRMAKQENVTTILDPAPAQVLPEELLALVDLITPNETEAAIVGTLDDRKVLLKLGEKGSRFGDIAVDAIAVKAVDTTAAGDTYNAGLAVGLSEGMDMSAAMKFASVAAGLAVTQMGAQSSAPTRAAVDAYLLSR